MSTCVKWGRCNEICWTSGITLSCITKHVHRKPNTTFSFVGRPSYSRTYSWLLDALKTACRLLVFSVSGTVAITLVVYHFWEASFRTLLDYFVREYQTRPLLSRGLVLREDTSGLHSRAFSIRQKHDLRSVPWRSPHRMHSLSVIF